MKHQRGEAFSKTQRYALERLTSGPREYGAEVVTYPVLERKGFIRRLAGPRPSRLASHPVILWEITEAGLAKLQEG